MVPAKLNSKYPFGTNREIAPENNNSCNVHNIYGKVRYKIGKVKGGKDREQNYGR